MTLPRLLDHPDRFRVGTRVLMLKGRHKDGIATERIVTRITHSVAHFNAALEELAKQARPGERVYASAGPRDIEAAAREFKRRQLDADYDDDPMRFYRAIEARWTSALMQPTCQAAKLWLFDCDTKEQSEQTALELVAHYGAERTEPYWYRTRSGWHAIVQPFDRTKLSDPIRALIHENPIMLWMHWE